MEIAFTYMRAAGAGKTSGGRAESGLLRLRTRLLRDVLTLTEAWLQVHRRSLLKNGGLGLGDGLLKLH